MSTLSTPKKTFRLFALAALLAVPCGLRADVFSIWPFGGGAASFQLMQFPNRGSLFGTYEIANSEIAPVMDDLTAKILSAGWAPATMEHADLFIGTGEIFMKKDPDALLLLGIVRDAAGAAQVSFYTRKLK